MAGDFAVTIDVTRPDGSVDRFAFTANGADHLIDAANVRTITFENVSDWHKVD